MHRRLEIAKILAHCLSYEPEHLVWIRLITAHEKTVIMSLCFKAEVRFQRQNLPFTRLSACPTRKKNHLCDTVCCALSFVVTLPHSLESRSLSTVSSHIKGETITLRYAKIQAHALIHTRNTRSQNSGDHLSAIPEGLAFPRKSWSHIRESEGGMWAATDLLSFPHILHLQHPATTHCALYGLWRWYTAWADSGPQHSINKRHL